MGIAAIVIDESDVVDLTMWMVQADSALVRLSMALEAIDVAAAENAARNLEIQERVQRLRKEILDGSPLVGLVGAEPSPRIVELLTSNMETLDTVGAELRVSLAAALRDEGLAISAIARLFGVTRQRISALLKQRAGDGGGMAE